MDISKVSCAGARLIGPIVATLRSMVNLMRTAHYPYSLVDLQYHIRFDNDMFITL